MYRILKMYISQSLYFDFDIEIHFSRRDDFFKNSANHFPLFFTDSFRFDPNFSMNIRYPSAGSMPMEEEDFTSYENR